MNNHEEQECQHEETDDEICGTCGGCGEGMYDGTRCGSCNGTSVTGNQVCLGCGEVIEFEGEDDGY